jgi:hypothetical protein
MTAAGRKLLATQALRRHKKRQTRRFPFPFVEYPTITALSLVVLGAIGLAWVACWLDKQEVISVGSAWISPPTKMIQARVEQPSGIQFEDHFERGRGYYVTTRGNDEISPYHADTSDPTPFDATATLEDRVVTLNYSIGDVETAVSVSVLATSDYATLIPRPRPYVIETENAWHIPAYWMPHGTNRAWGKH